MPGEPTVSVVLAVRNGERFLEEQLESIVAQTRPPDELLIRDDASTDRTPTLLEEFAGNAPFPVEITRNEQNRGPWDSFLELAHSAEGDFVAFADSDDVWAVNKLERLVEAALAASPPVSAIAHSYVVVDERLQPIGPGLIRRGRRLAPDRVPLFDSYNGFALFFDRSLLDIAIDDRQRPEDVHHVERPDVRRDPQMSHDKWIVFLSALDKGMLLIPDELVLYRQHAGNHSGASRGGVAADLRRARGAGRDHYLRLARLARERADVLAGVSSKRARDRAQVYRDFAAAVEARSALYEPSAGVVRRLSRWAALVARGAYRAQTSGGLGKRAAAKDAALVVLGARIVSV